MFITVVTRVSLRGIIKREKWASPSLSSNVSTYSQMSKSFLRVSSGCAQLPTASVDKEFERVTFGGCLKSSLFH